MNIRLLLMPTLLCAAALTGCNSAQSDWNQATGANTLSAYQTFLQKHADDKHADDARGRILALQDDHAWSSAKATNSVASYEDYLKAKSGGVHVGEAKYNITALQRADEWKTLQNNPFATSLQAFLLKYPQGLESNEARSKLKQLDYRLQLADAHNKDEAERKRRQLESKFGKVLNDIVVVPPNAPGTLYRVTSGPMDQAAANSACAKLQRAHQSCKLVQGDGTPG